MKILAADPGITGGLATYDRDAGRLLRAWMMPSYERQVKGMKLRRTLDEAKLWEQMGEARMFEGCEMLMVEKVGGLPGQSGSGAFTFGYGVGLLIMAGRALGMRIERAEPAIWKRAMKCPATKAAARLRASEVFPEHAGLWTKSKEDGVAEAALLAKYAGDHVL